MATKYRRLTYRDYDSSALVTALDSSIASSWQAMQEQRRQVRQWGNATTGDDFLYGYHREMARTFRGILLELLSIRREARES